MSKKDKSERGTPRHPGMAPSFEAALQVIEKTDRPPDYPGLTPETRRLASKAQFLTFFGKYWHDWRHSKLRAYRYLLQQRDAFLGAESERLSAAELDPATVIYQEFTNGIIASAVSEVCQYAEDLGLLSEAVGSDGFFARDVGSASAGKIQRCVKEWKDISGEHAAGVLRIPWFADRSEWDGTDVGAGYVNGIELSRRRLREISRFYETWEPHFMRYKHGLLFALRYSPGNREEQYLAQRRSSLTGFPVAFDCGSVAEAIDHDGNQILIMPDIGEESRDVRWNVAHLAAERNLLREIYPPDGQVGLSIDSLIQVASWISQCQLLLLGNRKLELVPESDVLCYLPDEDTSVLIPICKEQPPSKEGA